MKKCSRCGEETSCYEVSDGSFTVIVCVLCMRLIVLEWAHRKHEIESLKVS